MGNWIVMPSPDWPNVRDVRRRPQPHQETWLVVPGVRMSRELGCNARSFLNCIACWLPQTQPLDLILRILKPDKAWNFTHFGLHLSISEVAALFWD